MEDDKEKKAEVQEVKPGDFPKGVTLTAATVVKNNYHFPNLVEDGVEYCAIGVEASDSNEALDLWKLKRIPVEPENTKVDQGTNDSK